MIYELKYFDKTVLKFSAVDNSNEPDVKIIWADNDKTFLPLDLELTDEGLYKWLKHRTIPSNRAYVRNFLSKCGLSLNRPMNIIKVSKGLSLNDCYWIVEEGFDGSFDDYNLYDRPLSRILARIAFTGYSPIPNTTRRRSLVLWGSTRYHTIFLTGKVSCARIANFSQARIIRLFLSAELSKPAG